MTTPAILYGTPIITPDPHGRGWYIFVNGYRHDNSGKQLIDCKILGQGYADYHTAAQALHDMQHEA